MSSSGTTSRPADPHRTPLVAVLAAFSGGAASTTEVRRRTGLDDDVVAAAVEHLIRMGRLERSAVDLGCAPDACGRCPAGGSGASCGTTPQPAHHGRRDEHGRHHGDDDDVVGGRRLSGLHVRGPQ